MGNKGQVIAIVIAIIVILGLIGSCGESDYEKAGREFDSWSKEDPKSWSDSEKQYYEDFMDWVFNEDK